MDINILFYIRNKYVFSKKNQQPRNHNKHDKNIQMAYMYIAFSVHRVIHAYILYDKITYNWLYSKPCVEILRYKKKSII